MLADFENIGTRGNDTLSGAT